ncbi:hypothetical protein ABID99_005796 [Mucilaginibacter sp. OAE612]|uniref:hypothetical protein n=1 Tax=Mucilaginibacter sp. OAE612 TaxID=3156444 RepID=UPI00359DD1E1
MNNINLNISEGFLKSNPYSTYIVEAVNKITKLQNLAKVNLNLKSEVLVGSRKPSSTTITFNEDGTVATITIPFFVAYVNPNKTSAPPSVAGVISSIDHAIDRAGKLHKEQFPIDKSSESDGGESNFVDGNTTAL